jgi:GNAT superfamily N-acetyltransferase
MTAGAAGRDAPRSGGVDRVLGVLDEAAGWLSARDVQQWPLRFPARLVRPGVEAGHTWLGYLDGVAAATITLTWADPLWPPDDGLAGYVHRLAVRRTAAGLGARLLEWAAGAIRDEGRSVLRLDCVATNARLRAYYESAGFRHRGDVREAGGPRALLSRYEKTLR